MSVRFITALLCGLTGWCTLAGANRPPAPGHQVAIVISAGVPAYGEVLDGLRKGIRQQAVYVLDLRQKDAEQILNEALRLKTIKVVVTIGSDAAESVLALHPAATVIATATMPQLFAREGGRGRPISVIPVQVPLPAVLEDVKRVFPGKVRLGMIRNPTLPDAGVDAMKAAAEAAGFAPKIVDCAGPGQLLESFQMLKNQVDLVLCFPDASLYNSATIKPLVLASLRYRLPLIGFSESFARAGAVLGIYPDFYESGTRAAELVQKLLSGQPVPKVENPRKFRVAVNQNITRLLGLGYSPPSGTGEGFLVIR